MTWGRMSLRLCAVGVSFLGTMLFAACSGEGGGDSVDGPLTLKLGHVGAPGSLYQVVADEYARRVSERTQGRVTVDVFGSSQLGGDETLLQKLKLGTVDLSLPSTVMSSTVDAFGLFELPLLIRDREHMKAVEAELFWDDLAPLAQAEGYRVLAVWENGFRHITNNKRPIRGPADLAGIKLRVPRGRWRVRLFQAYGANPTPMPFSEVFVALQTGVMDGQENPLAQIYSAKLHEVQEYLSLTAHVYTPAYVTVGETRWNKLPVDVQAALAETAREMQPFVYEQAERLDAEILSALRDAGISINEADADAFTAASQPVYDEFATAFEGGAELTRRARTAGNR